MTGRCFNMHVKWLLTTATWLALLKCVKATIYSLHVEGGRLNYMPCLEGAHVELQWEIFVLNEAESAFLLWLPNWQISEGRWYFSTLSLVVLGSHVICTLHIKPICKIIPWKLLQSVCQFSIFILLRLFMRILYTGWCVYNLGLPHSIHSACSSAREWAWVWLKQYKDLTIGAYHTMENCSTITNIQITFQSIKLCK